MEASLKKVIFTCGGTAGHVNPAIALAQLMREKDPETEFLFVGAERGLEKDLIPKAGYDFRTVHISSFHRSFKPREIRHNLVSVGNLLRAPGEARAILRQFRPDVVIGTGGYASFPMVKAAAKAVREKSIEMIKQAQLLPLTGYVHGGCSPVGMKKQFPTVFDQSVEGLDTITVSAGKIGAQVELAPRALLDLLGASTADIVVDQG